MMAKIFNSLGSNYDCAQMWALKWGRNRGNGDEQRESLAAALQEKLTRADGAKPDIKLYYKAREALEVGWRASGLAAGDEVAINGFTCYVVYQSLARASLKAVYVDVGSKKLNFDLASLKAALKAHPKLKAVVFQNTFGYQPSELEAMVDFCRAKGLMIVEDLAHSLGMVYSWQNEAERTGYKNGPTAGTIGDWGVVSFSQDKGLDVVSGGALIINNPKLMKIKDRNQEEVLMEVGTRQQRKDHNYPWRTGLIRDWYWCGLGKAGHWWWKKRGELSNPMSYEGDEGGVHLMTGWQAEAAKEMLNNESSWPLVLDGRRAVARVYWLGLNKRWQVSDLEPWQIEWGSCLRYPILVEPGRRAGLIEFLAKRGIFVGDVWYDSVIAPKKWQAKSSYKKGECPEGERLAGAVLNLPTHRKMSERRAIKVVKLVNEYLERS